MRALPVHEGAFSVLLIFDCAPGESERFANELSEFIERRVRYHPGFLSALVYLSEDAAKVIELFQWARAEDWQRYRASTDGRDAVQWLAGHRPSVQYLELVRGIVNPPPGDSGSWPTASP